MAKKILTVKYFNGGIADSEKEGVKGAFSIAQNLDIVTEPASFTLNKRTTKDSGSTVVGLIKWFISGSPHNTNLYSVDDGGRIYQRTSGGTWSLLRTVASCSGQGLEVFSNYLYYTQNTQVGRYGLLDGTPTFTDNWQTGLTDTSATGKKFAPIKAFANGLAVGHGNKLAWWDGSVWTLNRITLPTGFNIRSMEVIDEYLVISAWKGDSIITSEQGMAFFWNGTSITYDFPIPIPDGGIMAVINSRNRLLSLVNTDGTIYLNYQPFQKLIKVPFLPNSKYLEVYPGAITNWRGSTFIGVAANTDSTDIVQGVYQWGAKSDKYSEVLNLAYTPSHGKNQLTSIHIGALKGLGNVMYISWQDATARILTNVVFSNPGSTTVMGTYVGHGLGTGSVITVSGCTQAYANTTWTVTRLSDDTFTLDTALWASFTGADVTGDATIASNYGVDVVSTTASPFATGYYKSLIFDDNRPLQEKLAVTLIATHKALVSGESVQLGYKTNRASAYTTDTANTVVGSTKTRLPIQSDLSRFYDFEFEVIPATSTTTAPTVTSIGLEYDDLTEEELV